MKKNIKFFVFSMFLVFSIVFSYALNFKTFKDDVKKFKIILPEKAKNITKTDTMVDWEYDTEKGPITISVNIVDLSGLSPDKYISMMKNSKKSQFDNIEEFVVDNGKAIIFTDKMPSNDDGFYRYYIVAMSDKGRVYNVLVGGKKKTTNAFKQLVEKIIKSFNILK